MQVNPEEPAHAVLLQHIPSDLDQDQHALLIAALKEKSVDLETDIDLTPEKVRTFLPLARTPTTAHIFKVILTQTIAFNFITNLNSHSHSHPRIEVELKSTPASKYAVLRYQNSEQAAAAVKFLSDDSLVIKDITTMTSLSLMAFPAEFEQSRACIISGLDHSLKQDLLQVGFCKPKTDSDFVLKPLMVKIFKPALTPTYLINSILVDRTF